MTRSNGQSNGREDVTQVKALVCNALTITKEEKSSFIHQASIVHVMNVYSIH